MNLVAFCLISNAVGQKGYELRAGMPRHCPCPELAPFGVERSIQRQRALAVIIEPMAFGASGRERQHGLEAAQRLNGGVFVHAKHCGTRRRVEIKPDNIGRLGLKVRIAGRHVMLQTMRLQPMFGRYLGEHHVRDPQLLTQRISA